MSIMQRFGDATGLKINVQKSSVAAIRCSHVNLDAALESFQGEAVQFPINYLGLPLNLGRLKMSHLQPIMDRASGKLAGWQRNLFNIGGRKELIRSVLSPVPVYLMTDVRPPKRFYKVVDKLRRHFLWAGSEQLQGGGCKVNWDTVCHPIQRGGLGITNLTWKLLEEH